MKEKLDKIEDFDETMCDDVRYSSPDEFDAMELYRGLLRLYIINNDMFMRLQAYNINVVDAFITGIEYENLQQLKILERTPPETHFLGAQTQMWIFAAYELLRTWQERCRQILKWTDNGGLLQKLDALKEQEDGTIHFGRENQIQQLESILADPSIIKRIRHELAHVHIPFARLEFIRVAIAKHQVSGKAKSVSLMPGYGRINMFCGALDYQMDSGNVILGLINRRDIADSIRAIDLDRAPPSNDTIKSFDAFMSGKPLTADAFQSDRGTR